MPGWACGPPPTSPPAPLPTTRRPVPAKESPQNPEGCCKNRLGYLRKPQGRWQPARASDAEPEASAGDPENVPPPHHLSRGWGSPLGAIYLRSMSEPLGEESERRAPGGGPLSWGGTGRRNTSQVRKEPPPKNPTHPPTPPHLQPAAGSGIPRPVGGGEKLQEMLILGVIRDRERPHQPPMAAA